MKNSQVYVAGIALTFILCAVFLNKRDKDSHAAQIQLNEFVSSLPNYADSVREYDAKNADDIWHLQNIVDFLNTNPMKNVNRDSLQRELLNKRIARQKLINAQEQVEKLKQQHLDSVRHANRFNLYVRNSSLQYTK